MCHILIASNLLLGVQGLVRPHEPPGHPTHRFLIPDCSSEGPLAPEILRGQEPIQSRTLCRSLYSRRCGSLEDGFDFARLVDWPVGVMSEILTRGTGRPPPWLTFSLL